MDEKAAYLWAGQCLKPVHNLIDAHLLHSIADKIASALVEATKEADAELVARDYAIFLLTVELVRQQANYAKLISDMASMRAAVKGDGGELVEQGDDAKP